MSVAAFLPMLRGKRASTIMVATKISTVIAIAIMVTAGENTGAISNAWYCGGAVSAGCHAAPSR